MGQLANCRCLPTTRVMLIIFVLFGTATFLQAAARRPHPHIIKPVPHPEIIPVPHPEIIPVPHPEIIPERIFATGLLPPPPELVGPPFRTEAFREWLKGKSKEELARGKPFLKKDLDWFKCSRPHIHNPGHLYNRRCKIVNANLDILEKRLGLDVVPELPEISTKRKFATGLLSHPEDQKE